jgi:hypothetical protein
MPFLWRLQGRNCRNSDGVSPAEDLPCWIRKPYWGMEQMTRLLRVNKQIRDEAGGVAYRDFTIKWSQWACACSVPLLWKRQIKQQALHESLLAELPALRSVYIWINLLPRGPIDEAKKASLVDNIVRLAGVFRDIGS